jgi:hypothetical protein
LVPLKRILIALATRCLELKMWLVRDLNRKSSEITENNQQSSHHGDPSVYFQLQKQIVGDGHQAASKKSWDKSQPKDGNILKYLVSFKIALRRFRCYYRRVFASNFAERVIPIVARQIGGRCYKLLP